MKEKELYLKELENNIKLRGFTPKTRKSYLYSTSKYIDFLEKTSLKPCSSSAKEYLLYLIDKKYSQNTLRLSSASILYFLKNILKQKVSFVDIPKVKKIKLLPKTLNKIEIKKMIEKTDNLKHKLIISLLYSAGLRLSELTNLKKEDLNLENNTIYISQGKGQKDRVTLLSEVVRSLLLKYLCTYTSKSIYLIEGRRGKYTSRSVQNVINMAAIRAKIEKKVTPHMLRHSFATHLLEDGVDIRHIQKLLGHSKLETTSLYTHVATRNLENIKSPLDKI